MERNERTDYFPLWLFFGLVLLVLNLHLPASAGPTFCFERITSNTPEGYLLPTIEMTLDSYTLPDGDEGVLFTFGLTGPGCITEIYFDDGDLLAVAQIINTPPAVSFTTGANPQNLPGGNELAVPFKATQMLSVEASGNASTGIHDGETLGVVYSLWNDMGYNDVLDALYLGYVNPSQAGSLRIGLHVRGLGLGGEESDSYIAVIPAPAAGMLTGVGLGIIGWLRRRRTI